MTDQTVKKDFLGQEIKIGDRVITHATAKYAGLKWATVDALLPKMVRIRFHGKSISLDRRYPQDLVVLNEEQEGFLITKIIGG